jgi:hypothetical protein
MNLMGLSLIENKKQNHQGSICGQDPQENEIVGEAYGF